MYTFLLYKSIYSTIILSVGLSVRLQKAKELRYLWMLSSLFFVWIIMFYFQTISYECNGISIPFALRVEGCQRSKQLHPVQNYTENSLKQKDIIMKATWCLSGTPSVYLSFSLSVCMSVWSNILMSNCLSICPPVCLSTCLSVHLSICPSAHLSVCLYQQFSSKVGPICVSLKLRF